MLENLNKHLDKLMPFITPVSVIIGIFLSNDIKEFSFLIPWIFALMTFSGSLGSHFKSLKDAVIRPFPVVIALVILHIIMPLWAWVMGHLFFSYDSYTITGLILGMIIPTGITSFIWVTMHKGHTTLTLSIILIDTLLSPLVVPFSLSVLVGQRVHMNTLGMMYGLLGMIVIPSLVGMGLNHLTHGRSKTFLGPRLAPFSKIGLSIVVMLNGAVVAPYFRHFSFKLLSIGLVVLLMAISAFLVSLTLGKLLKRDRETMIALTYTGGMRNISAGAVIAVAYFSAPVVVPVVIGMLFQQILASLFGVIINNYFPKNKILAVSHDS